MYIALPKHKGTEKLQAELKAKISRAKEELEGPKKSAKKGISHKIPREGAGQVMILGAPNVGKSQILAALTRDPADDCFRFAPASIEACHA